MTFLGHHHTEQAKELVRQAKLGAKNYNLGSHQDFIATDNKGHGYHKTIEEHTTHYRDCLPGKVWLKKHAKDKYLEPTIVITVDGKSLSVNGNYKQGKIKEFMGHYCHPREGKIRLVKVE